MLLLYFQLGLNFLHDVLKQKWRITKMSLYLYKPKKAIVFLKKTSSSFGFKFAIVFARNHCLPLKPLPNWNCHLVFFGQILSTLSLLSPVGFYYVVNKDDYFLYKYFLDNIQQFFQYWGMQLTKTHNIHWYWLKSSTNEGVSTAHWQLPCCYLIMHLISMT